MRRKPVREEINARASAREWTGIGPEAFDTAPVAIDVGEIPVLSANPKELMADLFHALNQPLAALRCSCELALLAPRTTEQYRDCLQTALEKSEQASLLAKGIREYLEAKEGVGEKGEEETEEESNAVPLVSLQKHVREAVEYFLPAADAAGTTLKLDSGESSEEDLSDENSLVNFHPENLRRALFYIFDCLLSQSRGKEVRIRVENHGSQVTAYLNFPFLTVSAPDAHSATQTTYAQHSISLPKRNRQNCWQPKLQWAIAERLFRARQGSLIMTSNPGQLCVQASLPLATPDLRISPHR